MKQAYQQTKSLMMAGVDLILPPRCPVSGEIVDRQGVISPMVWRALDFITDPLCACCGIPLDFAVAHEAEKCTLCAEYPPLFTSARAAFQYGDMSRDLILGFKHGDKTHMVRVFVPWLMQAGKTMLEQADYLIPVPLHPQRLIARRYNQAALMADAVSKWGGIPHLPLALKRVRATPSQGHMRRDERIKNVEHAFDIDKKYKDLLKGKSVILIDDVYTTGATINECARVLLACRAAHVHVLTLARVV